MIFNISDGALKTPELNASYPANATVKSGTNATFKVEVSKDGIPSTYTYQWYVNDTAVSGANGASYTRSTSSDKGVYSVYCKVTNKAGTVVSRTATLTVNKTPVLNTSYPANASVPALASTTVKVAISTAGYPTSYTYQWYKNGSAVSGATGSSYTFTPTAAGSVTVYCKVTNTAGSVNSRTATITVNAPYLFNAGDECTAITGGWVNDANLLFDSRAHTATSTVEADSLLVSVKPTNKSTNIVTNNEIDMSNFSYLEFTITSSNTSATCNCVLYKKGTSTFVARKTFTKDGTYTLEIPSDGGPYRVGFGVSASSSARSFKVTKARLMT